MSENKSVLNLSTRQTQGHSDLYAFVNETEKRQGSGNPFWQMRLRTNEGPVKAMIWDVSDVPKQDPALPQKGELVKIVDFRDQRKEQYSNIVINKFERVEKSDIPKLALEEIFKVPKADMKRFKESYLYLCDKNHYQDESHYRFVMKCLEAFPREKLLRHPAAVAVHHHYQGGLVIHTAEVLKIAKAMAEAINPEIVDVDVVCAAATLHDIGKMETYYLDEVGLSKVKSIEKTLGHIFYGIEHVRQVAKECDVDERFLGEVVHAMAAHHGDPRYGSIKDNMTLESVCVAKGDFLGSRAGIVEKFIEENRGGGQDDIVSLMGDTYLITRKLEESLNREDNNGNAK